MYFIPQIGSSDCGFACLKMMLATIHKDSNYLYLPFHERKEPYSYQQLTALALQYNVEIIGFKVEDEDEIKKNEVFPILVSLDNEAGGKHAVLITKMKCGRVFIADPEKGTYSLSFKQFFRLWGRTGLLIRNYAITPCPILHQETLEKKDYILPFAAQIMTGIFGVLSVYFFDKTTPLIIPLTFLIAFVLCEICLRGSLFKLMRKTDLKILDQSDVKIRNYRLFHERFESFKRLMMSMPLNFVYYFMICAFLTFIIILNDPRNMFLIIAPLILAFFDAFYLHDICKKKERELEIEERALFKATDIEAFRQRENELHEKTYQYGKRVLIKKYFFIFVMLIATCGIMIVNEQFSIPFIIFYLSVEFALYTNLNNLFSFPDQRIKYLQAKVSLSNILHQNDEII